MERRSDRALPSIHNTHPILKTFPIFLVIITGAALGIFNYQKSSSSVVSSTMYALRTNQRARELLGDEIYFKHRIPWIWGELNQLHGRIDISYSVKGTREEGVVRFRSVRRGRMGMFETQDWSLQMKDGTTVQLLEENDPSPFQRPAGVATAGHDDDGSVIANA
ncbi:MAG: hypothetical protein M1816_002950 [Peltula sp. TS41687]|nr:MAG: hypothetical protein M1816_002950 [Peltula sp. TS41687]